MIQKYFEGKIQKIVYAPLRGDSHETNTTAITSLHQLPILAEVTMDVTSARMGNWCNDVIVVILVSWLSRVSQS